MWHLHSDLSNGVTNIDSVTKYNEYISYAQSLGMKAMGFSEHGSILEWVHKKTKIESYGIKSSPFCCAASASRYFLYGLCKLGEYAHNVEK